jgi:hypothetical protein
VQEEIAGDVEEVAPGGWRWSLELTIAEGTGCFEGRLLARQAYDESDQLPVLKPKGAIGEAACG